MNMEYCPICKALLKFNLTYNYDSPFIFYSCDNCGYNSNKTINIASTSNIYLNLQNIINDRSNIINCVNDNK